ncbi:DUF1206 domain-containing protein [Actinomadura sp. NPDC047616]|uniref:DUF1206 domain-containing protein n=1 Tax=Actinomadura sp. NPDC047616 TaxID=3155914 RepID=UPI0033EA7210
MATNTVAGRADHMGRKTVRSSWFRRLLRAGLVTRGVMYLLVGWLAVQIGLGHGGEEADRAGALRAVAERPGGTLALWLLIVGFAGLALWGYTEALYGQPSPDGRKARKRLSSLGRGLIYTAGFAATIAFVVGHGSRSSDAQSQTFTARAMGEPGGRWLVLGVGIAFVAVGVGVIVHAVRRKFQAELEHIDPRVRPVVDVLGVVGHVARGLVMGGAGVLLSYAAVSFDPHKAQGVDGTLREFARTPVGPWLLVAVAVGLLLFGLFSFCEARWRKLEHLG